MIKLPEPDTHCVDTDTDKDVWSHSPEQLKQTLRDFGEQCAQVAEALTAETEATTYADVAAAAIRALIKDIE